MIKNESGMNFIPDNYSYIMEDDIFYKKMANAHNPYGDGTASKKIVKQLKIK